MLGGVDLLERRLLRDRRDRLLERVEQREVARRCPALRGALRRALRRSRSSVRSNFRPSPASGPSDSTLRLQVLDQDVEVAHRAEDTAEPLELIADGLGPGGVEQVTSRPEKRAEAARRNPHLVELLWIGAEPGAGVVGEHTLRLSAELRAQRRRPRSRRRQARPTRARSRGPAPGRPSDGSRRRRRPLGAAPSRAAAASSRPRRGAPLRALRSVRATRRWSSTATRSCTTSAPSARMPFRRVRRRAIGWSGSPRRYPARSDSRASGAFLAAPGSSSSSRASSRGSFSCQRPLPFSSRYRKVTPRRASRWSAVSW